MDKPGENWRDERGSGDESTQRDASRAASPGAVFLSYRRPGGGWAAWWVSRALSDKFGEDTVFHDVRSIRPGDVFPDVITAAIKESSAVIVLVSPDWLGAGDNGARRIDDREDWPRVEVETAEEFGKPIYPVEVDGARMPDPRGLPPSLRNFALRQAVVLDQANPDIRRLLSELENLFQRDRRAGEC